VRSLNIRCSQSAEGVELAILGEITSWTAEDLIRSVNYFKGQPITLMLMSAGGDALASLGLHDFLGQHDVTIEIYGVAASGAAIVAASGKKVRIAENGFVMIHEAYTYDDQFNRVQDDNTRMIDDRQVEVFAKRTGKTRAKVREWLAAETFFTAEDAVTYGFADAVIKPMKMAASLKTMKPMSEVIKEAEVPEVPVVETPAAEVPATPAVEDPGDEQVEVEIPITTGEAIKAALAGKFKAKVNISATYGKVIGELTDELRTVRASLDEANAQVEALAPKAAEAEAATAKAAEAEAKVAEVVKEVETLKATPIEEPVKPTSDANGVVPAGTAPKPTKASETAQAMARSMERLDRVLGIQKN
jgi:ATP-dependent Clp protease protease subunit